MKKGSMSVFLIIGIMLIIIIAGLIYYMEMFTKKSLDVAPDNSLNFQKYFDNCALNAIIRSNVLYGLISDKRGYESSISSSVDSCMAPFLDALKKQGYEIAKQKDTSSNLEVNDNTIAVTISYPIDISKENSRFSFSDYTKTFERLTKIDLNDVKDQIIFSPDNIARIDVTQGTKLSDIYGKPQDNLLLVKLLDKKEENGGELLGNLIYGLLPVEDISTNPIKLCFYISDLLPNNDVPIDKLKVAWYNPHSNEWGYLDSEYKDGCLMTTINYTTFYGIVEVKDVNYPTGMPILNSPDEQAANNNLPSGPSTNTPPPTYGIFPGKWVDIFNQINREMGGPYQLDVNPQCLHAITGSAYCLVGATKNPNCDAAVHCNGDKLNTMTPEQQNMLFRHEIVHSIQINNDPGAVLCPLDSPRREWGAEYYSGTGCYTFDVDGKKGLSAKEVADMMTAKNPACTDDLFSKAAFCEPGSYEALKNCLLGKGGKEIADYQNHQKCGY